MRVPVAQRHEHVVDVERPRAGMDEGLIQCGIRIDESVVVSTDAFAHKRGRALDAVIRVREHQRRRREHEQSGELRGHLPQIVEEWLRCDDIRNRAIVSQRA